MQPIVLDALDESVCFDLRMQITKRESVYNLQVSTTNIPSIYTVILSLGGYKVIFVLKVVSRFYHCTSKKILQEFNKLANALQPSFLVNTIAKKSCFNVVWGCYNSLNVQKIILINKVWKNHWAISQKFTVQKKNQSKASINFQSYYITYWFLCLFRDWLLPLRFVLRH